MIGKFFLCLLIPLKLFGEIESSQNQTHNQDLELEFDFTKMLSLTVEFPLGLTESNEELLLGPSAIRHEMKLYKEWMEKHAFPWLKFLITLGFFGVTWLFYLFSENLFIKLKKRNGLSKQKPTLNESIDYLINKQWLEKGQAKEFYSELNKLLIIYLSEKINLSLNTKTPKEITQIILDNELFNSIQKQNLIHIFNSFEYFKFSNKIPSLNDSKILIKKIKDLL